MERATSAILTVRDDACRDHVPFPGHPERPERLAAALEWGERHSTMLVSPSCSDEDVMVALAAVHDPALPARLKEACRSHPKIFDGPDNPISAGTYHAACRAVACGLEAAARVAAGQATRVWVPVRPPGHHAVRNRAMGFCFFNTVAVTAEDLLRRGLSPLAVIDIDVHHGNGTQQHFWRRGDVFYLSVHQYPAFPGGGGADEIGEGEGLGTTRNIPLAAGTDDGTFCGALEIGIDELAKVMKPAVVLVSAGFDGHAEDPLSDFRLTEEGFRRAGELVSAFAKDRPLISVLEGGYQLDSLRRSVGAYLEGTAGAASS